jgi:hypothetical protein
MKVLSVYRCVVISYVGRCCVWMEICHLILSSSILCTCEIGFDHGLHIPRFLGHRLCELQDTCREPQGIICTCQLLLQCH